MTSLCVIAAQFVAVMTAMAAEEPKMCKEMGCSSGLHIELSSAYRWKSGNYRFEFLLDGQKTTCRGALPLPPCEQPGIHCNRPGVLLDVAGCALKPTDQGFGPMILVENQPRNVSVEIFRGRERIAKASAVVDYKTVRPNGEGCEPVCQQASLKVPLR